MTGHRVSVTFVEEVARFQGTASQVARLRARSHTRTESPADTGEASPRKERRISPPTGDKRRWDRFLLWLAGVDYGLASRSYVDRTRYATVGLAILVTALAAGISFFLVVSSAGVSPTMSVLLSIPWAVLIATVQRSLAASGTRRFDSFGRTIAVACFRTAIAVLIAVAIAQPLMLRLFQPEIENQIQTTRVAQSQAFTSREYNSELFRNARKELDAARLRLDQARMATLCEITGSCGTGQAGQGNLARQRRLEEEQAQTDFDAANSRYQTVLAQIERSSQAVAMRPVGLVEQFEAYSDVSDRNPSVAAAFWVVGALFVTVEMLPVLLIGAARRRGTTLYEKLLAINERYERDKFEFEAALAAGQRLTDESDPEVDDVLRRFEQQRDEIDQNTQATLSSVVQLAEEREIRHRAG